jgi:hypothetical protein
VAHRGRENADDRLILSLVRGATVQQAAREAGIGARTAHRRMADEAFVAKLRAAQEAAFRDGLGQMAAAFAVAVAKLLDLMSSGSEKTQVAAARAIVAAAPRVRHDVELEQRLLELERALDAALQD